MFKETWGGSAACEVHYYIQEYLSCLKSFPGGSDGKGVCLQCRRPRFNLWVGKMPWRRKWQPTPVLLPGKFHGWRSLGGYSPWGRKEWDTTERLHFHFSTNLMICMCFLLHFLSLLLKGHLEAETANQGACMHLFHSTQSMPNGFNN